MCVYLRLWFVQPSALLLDADTVSMLVSSSGANGGDVVVDGGDEGESKNTI